MTQHCVGSALRLTQPTISDYREIKRMAYETLIAEHDGPVLKVALNRPEARNALSPAMVRELDQVFQNARDDASVRVVVLSGAGGTFCAGGDLKGMEGSDA